jgi:hypothetical protein
MRPKPVDEVLDAVRFARMDADPVARTNYLLEAVERLVEVIRELQDEVETLRSPRLPVTDSKELGDTKP